METDNRAFETFMQAVDAARQGDESKLDELGWERVEYDGEVTYKFNHPSELQRFAMLQQAKRLIAHAELLMNVATDYDGDDTIDFDDDMVGLFQHMYDATQDISTMTDEEIIKCEWIELPFNLPIY